MEEYNRKNILDRLLKDYHLCQRYIEELQPKKLKLNRKLIRDDWDWYETQTPR